MLEETGFADEELNHLYGYVGQNPLGWYDPYGLAKNKNKGKKPNPNRNPNKKKGGGSGTGTRKGDAGRERTKGHPNAEEHNIKPPGGFAPRICPYCIFFDPCKIDPSLCIDCSITPWLPECIENEC